MAVCGGWPKLSSQMVSKTRCSGDALPQSLALETSSLEEQLDSDWAIRTWRASGRPMIWLQPESSLPEVGILPGIATGDCGPVASGTVVILLRTNTYLIGRLGRRCLIFTTLCPWVETIIFRPKISPPKSDRRFWRKWTWAWWKDHTRGGSPPMWMHSRGTLPRTSGSHWRGRQDPHNLWWELGPRELPHPTKHRGKDHSTHRDGLHTDHPLAIHQQGDDI